MNIVYLLTCWESRVHKRKKILKFMVKSAESTFFLAQLKSIDIVGKRAMCQIQ